jgi:hypothetical protein
VKDAMPRLPEQSFILNSKPSENPTAQFFAGDNTMAIEKLFHAEHFRT